MVEETVLICRADLGRAFQQTHEVGVYLHFSGAQRGYMTGPRTQLGSEPPPASHFQCPFLSPVLRVRKGKL